MCVPWFNTIPPPFPHHPHQPPRKNLHGSISAEGCQPFCTAPVTLINSDTEWGQNKSTETNSSHLKMDGWKMTRPPDRCELLVLGRLFVELISRKFKHQKKVTSTVSTSQINGWEKNNGWPTTHVSWRVLIHAFKTGNGFFKAFLLSPFGDDPTHFLPT